MNSRVQLFCYHISNSHILVFTFFYILAIYLEDNHWELVYLWMLFVLLLIILGNRKSLKLFYLILIICIALFLGSIRYEIFIHNNYEKHKSLINSNVVIEGVVVEESVKVSERQIKTVVQDKKIGRILIYMERFPEYKVGDNLFLIGKLELAPEFKDFSYLKYLQTESIFFVIRKVDKARKIGTVSGIWGSIYKYRNDKIDLIDQTFHYPASALVKGMVFGISSDFNEQWEDILKRTGTMHVIAVSGFNISVLFNFIYTLNHIWSRKLVNALSVVLLMLFVVLIGPYNYSALRAVIFAFFLILGKSLGRRISNLNLISLAVLCILIFNPVAYRSLSLAFSLASIVAIFYVNKLIKKYIRVPELVALAIAISVLTGAFQIYFFESFSLIGILINILIGPIVSLITILSMLFVLVGGMGVVLGEYISLPVSFFLSLLIFCSRFDNLYLTALSIDSKTLVSICGLIFYLSFNHYFIYIYKKLSLKRPECYA